MWQTPEVGEQVMEGMTPEAITDTLAEQLGSHERAAAVGSHVDDTMKKCVLALYRSAADVFASWHDDVDRVLSTRPGAVFWGADDPYVTQDFGARLATRTHAKLHMFPHSGHWWPVTEPDEVAAGLQELWRSADR
jgi:pimeloyl-ACP methyl ester carboxylesterase